MGLPEELNPDNWIYYNDTKKVKKEELDRTKNISIIVGCKHMTNDISIVFPDIPVIVKHIVFETDKIREDYKEMMLKCIPGGFGDFEHYRSFFDGRIYYMTNNPAYDICNSLFWQKSHPQLKLDCFNEEDEKSCEIEGGGERERFSLENIGIISENGATFFLIGALDFEDTGRMEKYSCTFNVIPKLFLSEIISVAILKDNSSVEYRKITNTFKKLLIDFAKKSGLDVDGLYIDYIPTYIPGGVITTVVVVHDYLVKSVMYKDYFDVRYTNKTKFISDVDEAYPYTAKSVDSDFYYCSNLISNVVCKKTSRKFRDCKITLVYENMSACFSPEYEDGTNYPFIIGLEEYEEECKNLSLMYD